MTSLRSLVLHNGSPRERMLVGVCNPLLDISASVDEALLKKYALKPNDAILADESHRPLYEELVANHTVEYIAGGSGQNTLRIAQWILPERNITSFLGCVGNDIFSKTLEEKAREAGVHVVYEYSEKDATGTCAVLITDGGKQRSLCANLAAANHFSTAHIEKPQHKDLIHSADFYYITGFFLTVNVDVILTIAKHACEKNKLFMMNLNAPFLVQFFKEKMMSVFGYIDILFGNDTEFETFALEHKLAEKDNMDMKRVALDITQMPKFNTNRQRIVIVTQGEKPVLVAHDGIVTEFPVIEVPKEKLVDTNGAGDAFVGGFIAQLLQGKPFESCIKCGIWAATHIIQMYGCTIPENVKYEEW
ncbi:uncharacterized protein LOC136036439 [Artemia franciscana]